MRRAMPLVGGPLHGETVDVDPLALVPVLGIACLLDALPGLPDYLDSLGLPDAVAYSDAALGLEPLWALALYTLVGVSRIVYGSLATTTELPARYVFTGVKSLRNGSVILDDATVTAMDSDAPVGLAADVLADRLHHPEVPSWT